MGCGLLSALVFLFDQAYRLLAVFGHGDKLSFDLVRCMRAACGLRADCVRIACVGHGDKLSFDLVTARWRMLDDCPMTAC